MQLLALLGVFCSLRRFVQIQAVAQVLKSGSPVKSIDLGDTCISDDGAQARNMACRGGLEGSQMCCSNRGGSVSSYHAFHCNATTATTHSFV